MHEDLQGQGIGLRLLQNLIVEGKARGAKELQASVGNPAALKALAKTMGREHIHYFDGN